jgi:hypothetical protein
MSDTARAKSAGDRLTALEINQDLPIQITAGETIDASSNPIAVYIKDADGKVYKTNAAHSDERIHSFIGFAMTSGDDNDDITLQKDGVVNGFTGLTAGAEYYLSDTAGEISDTGGTNTRVIGFAVDANRLLLRENTGARIQVIASDTLRLSANTVRNKTGAGSTDYSKIKEIKVIRAGTYRVKFDMRRSSGTAAYVYGTVYKNGIAHGTEQNESSASFVTLSQDLVFAASDLVQLYYKTGNIADTVEIRNFRIYYDENLIFDTRGEVILD